MIEAGDPSFLECQSKDFLELQFRPFRLIQNGLSFPDSIGSERHIGCDPDPGGAGSPGGLHRGLAPDIALAIRSWEFDRPKKAPALLGNRCDQETAGDHWLRDESRVKRGSDEV